VSGRVLRDNTWVGGKLYRKGSTPPDDAAAQIGEHLWVDASAVETNVTPTGVALRGLADNTFVDGKPYAKGSFPPPEVAAKIADHLWAGGKRPETFVTGGPVDSMPAPGDLEPAPPQFQPPSQRQAPAVESVDDEPAGGQGDVSPASTVERPPLSGPGSSGAAWREYAGSLGVEVPEDAKRDDVIEQLRAAGKPVE
jgi:hypothetical protein